LRYVNLHRKGIVLTEMQANIDRACATAHCERLGKHANCQPGQRPRRRDIKPARLNEHGNLSRRNSNKLKKQNLAAG
jgi:hypothetical protein